MADILNELFMKMKMIMILVLLTKKTMISVWLIKMIMILVLLMKMRAEWWDHQSSQHPPLMNLQHILPLTTLCSVHTSLTTLCSVHTSLNTLCVLCPHYSHHTVQCAHFSRHTLCAASHTTAGFTFYCVASRSIAHSPSSASQQTCTQNLFCDTAFLLHQCTLLSHSTHITHFNLYTRRCGKESLPH